MDRVRSVSHSYGSGTAVWQNGSQAAGTGAVRVQVQGTAGGQSASQQNFGGQQFSQEETGKQPFGYQDQDQEELFALQDQARGEFFAQQGSGQQRVREQLFSRQEKARESVSQQEAQESVSQQEAQESVSQQGGVRRGKAIRLDRRETREQDALKMTPTQQRTQEQLAAWRSAQEFLARQQKAKEESEEGNSIISQLLDQAESIKEAFDPKNKKNLYDATMDLTLISQMEKVPPLKAMQVRILYKIRSIKTSGAKSSEIRVAVNKLKKVLGKVKAKIKSLKKEEQLETSRKKAEEAKRKAKEEALRRELELRKKVRKAKERKDIEESKMGLGANYGGPGEAVAPGLEMDIHSSLEAAAPSMEPGAVMDVAVADMGAAVADAGGAVDVSL